MLYCLIPLMLLTLTAISLAVIFHKDFVDLLSPVVFSLILILYGFYIFGLLPLGHILVSVLFLLIPVFAVVKGKLRLASVRQVISAPSFLAYLLGLAVFLLFSCTKFVSLWDCLRLWGAYPKALHTTGTLQLGENALLFSIMQSYPPGMPLLFYYFTKFSPVFPENALFFIYSFFGFSLMLPFLKDRNKHSAMLTLLAIIFIPYFITGMNSDDGYYYSSLFIDIPLGICCGYFFSRVFHSNNHFDRLCSVLSCGCLILLKDSGSFMAVCGIAGGLICYFVGKHKDHKAYFCYLALQLAILAFAYGSWKSMINRYTVVNHIQLDFQIPSVTTLSRLFFYFLRTPVSGLFTITGAVHVSLPAALLTLFFAKFLLAKENSETSLKEEISAIAVMIFCFALFFVGYCFSFIKDIEAQVYPSYVRYFCTLVSCALFVLLYDCRFRHRTYLDALSREMAAAVPADGYLFKLLASVRKGLCIVLILAMVFSSVLILFDFPSRQSHFYTQAESSAAALTETIHEPADVYLCIPETEEEFSRIHQRIYFNVLDDGIRIKNFYPESVITNPKYDFTGDSFLEHLVSNGYDYVMILAADEALLKQFYSLFPDVSMEDTNLIYKVDSDSNQLIRIR